MENIKLRNVGRPKLNYNNNIAEAEIEKYKNPVSLLKEAGGGRNQVCKAMEEYGRRIAIKEKEESALKMIAKGKLTFEEISEYLDLPVERVMELANLQLV